MNATGAHSYLLLPLLLLLYKNKPVDKANVLQHTMIASNKINPNSNFLLACHIAKHTQLFNHKSEDD